MVAHKTNWVKTCERKWRVRERERERKRGGERQRVGVRRQKVLNREEKESEHRLIKTSF